MYNFKKFLIIDACVFVFFKKVLGVCGCTTKFCLSLCVFVCFKNVLLISVFVRACKRLQAATIASTANTNFLLTLKGTQKIEFHHGSKQVESDAKLEKLSK